MNPAAHTLLRTSLLALAGVSVLAASALGRESDPKAPVVAGDGDSFALQQPGMYHPGWVDLNKNGIKDIYEDSTQPVDQRVNDLLQRMTRAERIGQLAQLLLPRGVDPQTSALIAAGGLGSCLGAAPTAGPRNRLQRVAVEDSRLGSSTDLRFRFNSRFSHDLPDSARALVFLGSGAGRARADRGRSRIGRRRS